MDIFGGQLFLFPHVDACGKHIPDSEQQKQRLLNTNGLICSRSFNRLTWLGQVNLEKRVGDEVRETVSSRSSRASWTVEMCLGFVPSANGSHWNTLSRGHKNI